MAAERSRRGTPEGAHPTIGLTARWRSCPEVLEKTEHGWTDSGTEEFVVALIDDDQVAVGQEGGPAQCQRWRGRDRAADHAHGHRPLHDDQRAGGRDVHHAAQLSADDKRALIDFLKTL